MVSCTVPSRWKKGWMKFHFSTEQRVYMMEQAGSVLLQHLLVPGACTCMGAPGSWSLKIMLLGLWPPCSMTPHATALGRISGYGDLSLLRDIRTLEESFSLPAKLYWGTPICVSYPCLKQRPLSPTVTGGSFAVQEGVFSNCAICSLLIGSLLEIEPGTLCRQSTWFVAELRFTSYSKRHH